MTETIQSSEPVPFIHRPLFTPTEAEVVLREIRIKPDEGNLFVSPAEILEAVATALHEAVFDLSGDFSDGVTIHSWI